MNHEELQEQEWKRIGRVFSRFPKPARSERFVQSVMFRVRALEQRAAEPLSVFSRWLMPAFAVAAACLALSIVAPPVDAVSVDSLLFSRTGSAFFSQGISSSQEVPSEDPLALLEKL